MFPPLAPRPWHHRCVLRPQSPLARVIVPAVVVATMALIGWMWLWGKSFIGSLAGALVLGLLVAAGQWWSIRSETRRLQ